MKPIELCIITILIVFAAGFGSWAAMDRIQKTCDSDDQATIINGTTYLCLSPRHVEMLRQQQQRSAWKGV